MKASGIHANDVEMMRPGNLYYSTLIQMPLVRNVLHKTKFHLILHNIIV
jgi:hypothetical protein